MIWQRQPWHWSLPDQAATWLQAANNTYGDGLFKPNADQARTAKTIWRCAYGKTTWPHEALKQYHEDTSTVLFLASTIRL